MHEFSPEAERAGLLSATQALMVGLLSTLRRKGVLEIDRRRIVVLDKDKLKALT